MTDLNEMILTELVRTELRQVLFTLAVEYNRFHLMLKTKPELASSATTSATFIDVVIPNVERLYKMFRDDYYNESQWDLIESGNHLKRAYGAVRDILDSHRNLERTRGDVDMAKRMFVMSSSSELYSIVMGFAHLLDEEDKKFIHSCTNWR